jgi:hypothetical protein
MDILSKITDAMQVVLSETADAIARKTGFIKRQRKLSGSDFAQTLVFGWLDNPDSTIEELAQTAATLGVSITPQGLDKRFTPDAAKFLQGILESAVSTAIAAEPVAIPILQRFNGVFIQDSSTVTLPDTLATIWSGCGGSSPKNTSSSVKTPIRLDLNTGKLTGPYLQSGRESDQKSQLRSEPLPKGSLRIADLGFLSLDDFSKMNEDGVYWLSRLKALCKGYTLDGKRWDLPNLLETYCPDKMDMQILLGIKERVPCRILAVKLPDDVANERRRKMKEIAKDKGTTVSERVLKLAGWTFICTNIPSELLTLEEGFVLMRTRWQIELIFKLWKSEGKIDEWRSEKPYRILCELYAKLVVMIIQHWILLTSWQYPDRSLFKSVKTIRKHAMSLAMAFSSGSKKQLTKVLKTIARCLSSGCRINKRKTILHTYQLLLAVT